jgi:FkbM family methyltransferase
MTFISYAQNFEDVMLWRALQHIPNGFYIDVGAMHPEFHSITRAFYDRGWRGVNIEPISEHFSAVVAARPRDVNLQIVLGAAPSECSFFVVPDTGLSTLDAEIAAQHRDSGRNVVEMRVPMTTLAEICRQHAPADIHFLKIDVEGAEQQVIAGANFKAFRPWIVLVEATRPLSAEESYDLWEPMLLTAGYHFVWFDGLNRFYLADERYEELRQQFRVPPNIFDAFTSAVESDLMQKWQDSEARAHQATLAADASETRLADVVRVIETMRTSLSWRITKPFRWIYSLLIGQSRYDY